MLLTLLTLLPPRHDDDQFKYYSEMEADER